MGLLSSSFEYIVRCYQRSKYVCDVSTFRNAFAAAQECRALSKLNPDYNFCYYVKRIKPDKNIDDRQLCFDF